jgi:hypothetical protein
VTADADGPDGLEPAAHAVTRRDDLTHLGVHEVTGEQVRKVREELKQDNPGMDISTDDIVRLTFMLAGRLSELDAIDDSGLSEQELDVLGPFAEAVERYADPHALGAANRSEAPVDDDPGGAE